MGALTWDGSGQKLYENGISKGVLYKKDNSTPAVWKGVAWNGLTSVSETPEGAEANDLYADNIKYATLRSAETFGGTIEAYTYPEEFESCNGEARLIAGMVIGQQKRDTFRLCYRTEQGSDENSEAGYKLHLVYGCTCTPSERTYETVNDNPDAITFSWEFDTNPVPVTGYKPTSLIVVDSRDFTTEAQKAALKKLENALYGVDADATATPAIAAADPYMPDPDDVKTLLTPANN